MHRSTFRRAFRRYAPFWLGRTLRGIYYLPSDVRDALLRRHNPMVPSRREAAFIGDGDFAGMGRRFLEQFVGLGGLQPDHHVLDIGCGIGRMALPLTRFLNAQGEYWGFDPVPAGIKWCEAHITPHFPNFHFYVADVWSKSYNRGGRTPSAAYRFPHADGSLDFVFATSVFTHMLPEDVDNYLANIARVLKPGGVCFATYFLLNDLTCNAAAAEDFRYPVDSSGACMAVSKVEFEKAVAFAEPFIREAHRRHGLIVDEPIRFGRWATPKGGPAYQDIVIGRKA
jgi:SAM-dependent methyltransferase